MFQNVFCSDYFGFDCPFDCAKQINIQNTLLIKLSSACSQKQNTRSIYGESHLKIVSCSWITCTTKSVVWSVHCLFHTENFAFLGYCFKRAACWSRVAGSPGSPLTFLVSYICLWRLLELGRKLGLSLLIKNGFT